LTYLAVGVQVLALFVTGFLSFVDNLKAIFGSLIDKEKTFFVFL